MTQNDSDPLPYTQVDRAVKPKVALLAGRLGVTTQHALGSLVEFWDLNGDPRDLEALLLAGQDAVVLPADEVRRRFLLASGKELDPAELATLGLLEPTGEQYRVRGMSRYFAPLKRRIQAKEAARAGGRASAKARLEAAGTAQPQKRVGSGVASTPAQATLEATPKRPRSGARSDAEAEPEATPEAAPNTACSGQRASKKTSPAKQPPDPRWLETLKGVESAFKDVTGVAYRFGGEADGAALKALLASSTPEEVLRRWRLGLEETGWHHVATVAQLRQKWNDLGALKPAAPKGESCVVWK